MRHPRTEQVHPNTIRRIIRQRVPTIDPVVKLVLARPKIKLRAEPPVTQTLHLDRRTTPTRETPHHLDPRRVGSKNPQRGLSIAQRLNHLTPPLAMETRALPTGQRRDAQTTQRRHNRCARQHAERTEIHPQGTLLTPTNTPPATHRQRTPPTHVTASQHPTQSVFPTSPAPSIHTPNPNARLQTAQPPVHPQPQYLLPRVH